MKTILVAAALLAAPLAASAATIVIDDFSSVQIVADRPLEGYPRTSEAFGPNVVGGFRQLTAKTLNRGGPFATSLSANQAGEELLNFSNQSNQRGVGTVRYDGQGQRGLGGVDLVQAGANRGIEFVVENADAELSITASITDTAGVMSMLDQTFSQEIKSQSVALRFADFTGGADLASVNSIQFVFAGPQDLDASFDRILVSAIPLPASGLLLGAALLGAAALRRRR